MVRQSCLELRPGRAVHLHRVVALLQRDVKHKAVRTEVLPQLPLDVALQIPPQA